MMREIFAEDGIHIRSPFLSFFDSAPAKLQSLKETNKSLL